MRSCCETNVDRRPTATVGKTNTAVVTLGGVDRRMQKDWGHDSSSSSARQVTLNLSGAAIYDATAAHRQCSSPNHAANNSATTSPLRAWLVIPS